MAVVRGVASLDNSNEHIRKVREPELDMHRIRPSESAAGRLISWLRWLMTANREVAGPPRRAVGRELEEAWPSGDR